MVEKFLEEVKRKMEEGKITEKELAKKCDCCGATIERLLRRNIGIKLELAGKMAKALGLSLDCICGITTKENLPDDFLEYAFRVQQRKYMRQDAKNILLELYDNKEITKLEHDAGIEKIEQIVDLFEKRRDMNLPDNSVWREACYQIVKGE